MKCRWRFDEPPYPPQFQYPPQYPPMYYQPPQVDRRNITEEIHWHMQTIDALKKAFKEEKKEHKKEGLSPGAIFALMVVSAPLVGMLYLTPILFFARMFK